MALQELTANSRGLLIGACLLFGVVGCKTTPRVRPLDPITMQQAIGIVNANSRQIHATLRAVGPVDGYFTRENGSHRSFHLDGVLFYLDPAFLRFDLKSFGDRQFLFGSNTTQYWVYSKADGRTFCGSHSEKAVVSAGLPVRPDQILDALGLSHIVGRDQLGSSRQAVHRVVDEYQQILYIKFGNDGRVSLEKEYWLDRYEPRLVRRVVFRNADGMVEMTSELDGYKRLGSNGPWLPTVMSVEWPLEGAAMSLHIRRWEFVEQIGPGAIQFAAPSDCEVIADDNQARWPLDKTFDGQRFSSLERNSSP